MAVTTYAGWVSDGRPAREAQPILDMVATFERHGYTVYWYPDQRHLEANPPEDHTPFSHTPWPGTQPYPLVLALDLMPKAGAGARSLAPIARRIIADKRAGRAPWIKYLNWTDEDGKVHHTKWQPDEVTTDSSDSGHIHISVRTDWSDPQQAAAAGHNIYAAKNWDPVAPGRIEDTMWQGYVPTGDDGVMVLTPWDSSVISFGCDFGSARLRVAEHIVGQPANKSWIITEIVIKSSDDRRHDLPARTSCDRRSVVRLPIDDTDKLDAPVSWLAWLA